MKQQATLKLLVILSVIAIALSAGLIYFYSRIQFIDGTVLATRADTADKNELSLHYETVKRLLVDSLAEREQAERFLVGTDEVVPFIQAVEGLAKEQGLSVLTSGVAIEPTASSSKYYETVRLDFTTTGTWAHTYAFLELSESMPKSVMIKRVSMRLIEADPDPKAKVVAPVLWKTDFEVVAVKKK